LRRLLLLLLSVALPLAACGGDDSSGDDAASEGTEATTTTESTTTTSEAEASTDVGPLCEELEALSDIDPDSLPTQADVERVTAAAESAPPEIAAALTTIAAVGQLIADEGPEALDADAIAELEAQTGGPAITDAGETLVEFTNSECGFDVPLFSSFT
jgi:hypothetical protein